MTIKEMYDFIKTYVDSKISKANEQLEDLFIKYKTKEVGENLNMVQKVGNMFVGNYNIAPTTRFDGSELQKGDLYFDSNLQLLRVYNGTDWNTVGIGQYCDQNKGIAYIATNSNINETIKIPEGTNGYSVGKYTLEDGSTLTIPDGSEYKIL